MTGEKVLVCRLCLEVVYSDKCKPLKSTLYSLESILPTLNVNISKDPVICSKCKGTLEKSFYFKSMCLETETYLQNSQLNKCSPVDLDEIVSNTILESAVVIREKFNKGRACRFCLQIVEDKSYVQLGIIEKDMIKKCILEVDLSFSYDPIICGSCLDELQNHFIFIMSCADVEDRIKNYCVMKGTNPSDKVNLHYILASSLKPEIDEDDHNMTFNELPNVKKETEDGSNSADWNNDIKYEEEAFNKNTFVIETPVARPEIAYQTIVKQLLQTGPFELYICKTCPYEAKRKDIIEKHVMLHEKPGKRFVHTCVECHYQTTRITDFRKHKLIHKAPNEVQMHKCKHCTFQAKQKSNLKTHMLIHQNPTEVKMYKCTQCDYQSKYTTGIKKHINNKHKGPNEVVMYNCPFNNCSYQTKQKCHINQHLYHSHKSEDNITWYKCVQCSYKAKQKSRLVKHLESHKEPHELITYKCQKCSYTTKVARNFRRHILKHEKKK